MPSGIVSPMNVRKSNSIRGWSSCFRLHWVNKNYFMWPRKHEKHELYWRNSSLENLVTDFQHQFHKKTWSTLQSSIVQSFFVCSIWLDCWNQLNSIDWVRSWLCRVNVMVYFLQNHLLSAYNRIEATKWLLLICNAKLKAR